MVRNQPFTSCVLKADQYDSYINRRIHATNEQNKEKENGDSLTHFLPI